LTGERVFCEAANSRRIVALAGLVALLVVLALAVSSLASRPAAASNPVVGRTVHVVQPGDTYWSIAESVAHDGDLRTFVDALVDANGGRPLVAGDRIEVP
jgi:hypothetical protein